MNYPYPSQNKNENFNYCVEIITQFCQFNNIPFPKIIIENRLPYHGMYDGSTQNIYVNVKTAKTPVKTPGFAWSYTGYKADLTPAGILAHEFGHYVDHYLKYISKKMKLVKESAVSSYEPNQSERFAESMKLFILNPDLLKTGRPQRYQFLTQKCNLKPVIVDEWNIVLGNAHEKLITAAKNWIKS